MEINKKYLHHWAKKREKKKKRRENIEPHTPKNKTKQKNNTHKKQ